ncbi:FAD binding domain-containing protein, partial [Candidatus Bipolaricaulota bacterium]
MRYVRVETVPEILDRLQEDGACLLAGGTDLIVKMRSGLAAPTLLVDVSDVKSLQGVVEADGAVEIGATTPEEDLLASPVLRERLPLLTTVLRVLGSVQIRTRGTLGGN